MSIGTFILFLLYFAPTAAAKPADRPMVGVINLFLGWTVIGWVVALAIAVRPSKG